MAVQNSGLSRVDCRQGHTHSRAVVVGRVRAAELYRSRDHAGNFRTSKVGANRRQHLVKGPTNIPELGISGQQIGRCPSRNRTAESGRASAGTYLFLMRVSAAE